MPALMDQAKHPFIASDEEAVIAREAAARLKPIADAKQDVRLRVMESADVVVPVPARLLGLLVEIMSAMAERKPVSFIPYDAELTTQQAADFLMVSRPYLINLLESGELPFRRVGTHRRIRVADIHAFRAKSLAQRDAAIDNIATLSQEMGLD
jgi:excisionase family DNA binding protein